jgi:hypothetical protein
LRFNVGTLVNEELENGYVTVQASAIECIATNSVSRGNLGAVLHKQFHDTQMTVTRCGMQSCGTAHVGDFHIGSVFQQHCHHLGKAVVR